MEWETASLPPTGTQTTLLPAHSGKIKELRQTSYLNKLSKRGLDGE